MRQDPRFLNTDVDLLIHERNLPHWHQEGVVQFVTWRLGDSLPIRLLNRWKREREMWELSHPEPWDEETESAYHQRFSRRIDEWLDQGMGSCLLRDPQHAEIQRDVLLSGHHETYALQAFVVMPNHVHALFRVQDDTPLWKIMKTLKGAASREINRFRNRRGSIWQAEYWDRIVRNEAHLRNVRRYILDNPKKARLRRGEYILWETERGL